MNNNNNNFMDEEFFFEDDHSVNENYEAEQNEKFVSLDNFVIKKETEKAYGLEAYFFDPTNGDIKYFDTTLFVPKSKINGDFQIEKSFFDYICKEKCAECENFIPAHKYGDLFIVEA